MDATADRHKEGLTRGSSTALLVVAADRGSSVPGRAPLRLGNAVLLPDVLESLVDHTKRQNQLSQVSDG